MHKGQEVPSQTTQKRYTTLAIVDSHYQTPRRTVFITV